MDVISILKKVGAVLSDGHFVGISGRHMGTYITKDALFPHVLDMKQVCKMFAEKNKDLDVEVVAAPAVGGIVFAQGVAYELSKIHNKEILAVFTEKTPEAGQVFTRGYDAYVKDKRVLVLEDLTTTGGSIEKVIKSVRGAGGNVIGVAVMVNKDPDNITEKSFGVPFRALGELKVETFEEGQCPLCKNNVPINTKFGHGNKFLESMK